MHAKESPHEAGCKNTHEEQAHCNAIRRLKGLLPTLSLEAAIVLEAARDAWLTGGIDEADGVRLKLAFDRLKKIAAVIDEAERAAKAGAR